MTRAEVLALPEEGSTALVQFLAEVQARGLTFSSIALPIAPSSGDGVASRSKWLQSAALRRVAKTVMAYYQDAAGQIEASVRFSPSLYAGSVRPFPSFGETVKSINLQSTLADVISAMLRRSISVKGSSVLDPLAQAVMQTLSKDSYAEKISEAQGIVLTLADPLSKSITTRTVGDEAKRVLENMGPGMLAAVERVVTAVKDGDLMVTQITQGRNLGALRVRTT